MATKQIETKCGEANVGVLRKRFKEDIVINVEGDLELMDDNQRRNVQESGVKCICTSSLPVEEEDDVIASSSLNNRLLNVMKGMLDDVKPALPSNYSIYRVPHAIRRSNEEAYDPRVTSFGPIHHGKERLRSMEALKIRYFRKLVERNSSRVGLEKYVEFLKDQEESVRQCYSEIFEMASDDFLKMLLLDSCFIIELLLCFHKKKFRDEDYFGLMKRRLWGDIRHDLILLENQVPFFLLEGLFNLSKSGFDEIPQLLNLVMSFFGTYNAQKKTPEEINTIMHFTDLILIFHQPKSFPMISNSKEFITTNSATELHEAGVQFVMSSSKCLLDIRFTRNGVLEIPHLSIYDKTESTMRNLIALEICHYPHNIYMTDFFLFMDYLVKTAKDADLLVQSGIVRNGIGDTKQVAALYNNICKNVGTRNYKFSQLSEELNMYCKVPRHKWRAALKRDYFSTPWRGASTSAAIILLVLTFIQTICSLVSVSKGN